MRLTAVAACAGVVVDVLGAAVTGLAAGVAPLLSGFAPVGLAEVVVFVVAGFVDVAGIADVVGVVVCATAAAATVAGVVVRGIATAASCELPRASSAGCAILADGSLIMIGWLGSQLASTPLGIACAALSAIGATPGSGTASCTRACAETPPT